MLEFSLRDLELTWQARHGRVDLRQRYHERLRTDTRVLVLMAYLIMNRPLWFRLVVASGGAFAASVMYALLVLVPNASVFHGAAGEGVAIGCAVGGVVAGAYAIRLKPKRTSKLEADHRRTNSP